MKIKIFKICLSLLLLIGAAYTLGGCSQKSQTNVPASPTMTETTTNYKNSETAKVSISKETQDYQDDNFDFSFSYPKSLTFETQTPYPGGTIKAIGFRVDGITESQLLSKDLGQSLKSNDLYCNLDESFGQAVCLNKNVEPYNNVQGMAGFKISREKTFYNEESGDPIVYQDIVYAFPINEKNPSVSTYKAIVFSVKMPSEQNLELLKQIAETVKTN